MLDSGAYVKELIRRSADLQMHRIRSQFPLKMGVTEIKTYTAVLQSGIIQQLQQFIPSLEKEYPAARRDYLSYVRIFYTKQLTAAMDTLPLDDLYPILDSISDLFALSKIFEAEGDALNFDLIFSPLILKRGPDLKVHFSAVLKSAMAGENWELPKGSDRSSLEATATSLEDIFVTVDKNRKFSKLVIPSSFTCQAVLLDNLQEMLLGYMRYISDECTPVSQMLVPFVSRLEQNPHFELALIPTKQLLSMYKLLFPDDLTSTSLLPTLSLPTLPSTSLPTSPSSSFKVRSKKPLSAKGQAVRDAFFQHMQDVHKDRFTISRCNELTPSQYRVLVATCAELAQKLENFKKGAKDGVLELAEAVGKQFSTVIVPPESPLYSRIDETIRRRSSASGSIQPSSVQLPVDDVAMLLVEHLEDAIAPLISIAETLTDAAARTLTGKLIILPHGDFLFNKMYIPDFSQNRLQVLLTDHLNKSLHELIGDCFSSLLRVLSLSSPLPRFSLR